MTRRLILFVGGMAVCGLIAAWPAYSLWQEIGLLYVGLAVGLCLVPGLATLAWGLWSAKHAPQTLLVTVLGGTGVRMFAVFAGMLIAQQTIPATQNVGFLATVGIFYMVSLALEIALLLSGLPASARQDSGQV
jgi:hypothetical protein